MMSVIKPILPVDLLEPGHDDPVTPAVHNLFQQKVGNYLLDGAAQLAHAALDAVRGVSSRTQISLRSGFLRFR